MSCWIMSTAEISNISWKQVFLTSQWTVCVYSWYKSNFSPFLVVSLLVKSHSKNARFNLRFPIRLISLQGLSQTLLRLFYTLPFLVKTHHTFHMSQQSWAASPAAGGEAAERGALLYCSKQSFTSAWGRMLREMQPLSKILLGDCNKLHLSLN